jgi:hypothetical protein
MCEVITLLPLYAFMAWCSVKEAEGQQPYLFLYERETQSVTVKVEHSLWVSVNRVLRRIFGPNRAEMTRDWRRLRNEEPHKFCASANVMKVIKSRRHVACMGYMTNAYITLVRGHKRRRRGVQGVNNALP